MRHRGPYYGILLLAALGGCATQPAPQPAPPPIEPVPAPPPPVEVPPGTAKELFRDGVEALQQGDGEKARPLLRQVLVLDPEHRHAAGLLEQIDADPLAMLGAEYFAYKVQPGDTLSRIAKRFLEDPFKFYILARYNGIGLSDRLEAGRTIRIPGKKPPSDKVIPAVAPEGSDAAAKPIAPATPTADETARSRLVEARRLHAAGKHAEALRLLERMRTEAGTSAELDALSLEIYQAHAKKLTDTGQYAEAEKTLVAALAAHPGDAQLKRLHDLAGTQRNADLAYREGNRWLGEGQPARAYAAYTRVLALVPEHEGARAAMAKTRPQAVEAYYTEYVRARRRQDLAEAKASLARLLEIDPGHELARTSLQEVDAILRRERAEKAR